VAAAAKGKKNAKVKWAIGGAEPDDLPDFQSNDDIVRKNKGKLPPKGRTKMRIKKVTSKENRNGDQMLTVTCEIAEGTAKKPGPFDGYTCWERLNITEQGAPFLKRFLTAIGVKWGDFISNTVADESQEPTVINKIGSVTFGGKKEVVAWASLKHTTDQNDDEVAEIGRFLPPADEDESDDVEDDDEDDEDDEDVDVAEDDDDDDDDVEDDDDDEEEEDDEEDDDEDAEADLRDELSALKLPALKKRAIRAGADEEDMPGKKAGLIDLIVELELEDDDDEDEEDDEDDDDESEAPDPDELRKELKGMALSDLRDRAGEAGAKPKALKGKKKPALIDLIIELEIPPF
jgi:hypothetical protein